MPIFTRLSWVIFFLFNHPDVTASEHSFRVGVINERPQMPEYALHQFGLLQHYLVSKLAPLNITVEPLFVAKTIEEMIQAFKRGHVDALFEGMFPTLMIEQRTQCLDPSLLVWRKGQRQYHSVFFVHKNSPYYELDDLTGKNIVFESPRSTSAFFLPYLTLQSEHIKLASMEDKAFSPDALRYQFAGSELNQAYWVYLGRADVGAFNNGDWQRTPEKMRQELRIIHSTRPVLRWLFSLSCSLNASAKDKVKHVLLNAHHDEQGQQAITNAANIAKFEVLNAQDFENINYWKDIIKLHK